MSLDKKEYHLFVGGGRGVKTELAKFLVNKCRGCKGGGGAGIGVKNNEPRSREFEGKRFSEAPAANRKIENESEK